MLDDSELSDVALFFQKKRKKSGEVFHLNFLPFSLLSSGFNNKKNSSLHRAHRAILSARCQTFKAMFRSGMKESNEGTVVVEDISYISFHSMLDYLYSGQLVASPEDVVPLLGVADRYGLEHLKYLCEKKLLKYVVKDNVVEILAIADRYKAQELKDFCLKFVVRNYSTIIETLLSSLQPELLLQINTLLKMKK